MVVHCRQGIGRSGLVAACLLVRKGISPGAAVEMVSAARGVSVPETTEQTRLDRPLRGRVVRHEVRQSALPGNSQTIMKRIAILGSTGSIGRSTLSVAESYPDRFQIVTLAAGTNLEAAFEQALRWRPRVISMAAEADADILRARLKKEALSEIEVVHGAAGTVRVATHPEVDFVVSAIVGVAGLEATYEAVRAGKVLGLANKECLVAAGELITAEARKQGKPLLPIDSEHNAVHQCLRGGRMDEVERIWLTASGGPFLHKPQSEFASITVEQALEPSYVEDGAANHDRLGHADEQRV